ncbi:MAG: hypothetical protein K8L97_01660 [Anaerolineae bacterium]|nr:hypothetical protein [Anaerolineae bacterium]
MNTKTYITLGGVRNKAFQHEYGIDCYQTSVVARRDTEERVERRQALGGWTRDMEHLLFLERVALQPERFWDVCADAPRTPLYGEALYAWLAGQMGWTVSRVKEGLNALTEMMACLS